MLKELKSILIKPAGPDCNMACRYCFYLPKKALFSEEIKGKPALRMGESILKQIVKQTLDHDVNGFSFAWQGGEPTLMGIDFFKKAVDLQSRFGGDYEIENSLQTNGLQVNREWARFLARSNFLVGLSLDGPQHIHDTYRLLKNGKGSWQQVVDKAKCLLDGGAEVNALVVVNDYSVQFPEEIYEFNKSLGLYHMQFIPCAEPEWRADGERYGDFLVTLFDLWLNDFKEGRPTSFIRFFDAIFYWYFGLVSPLCVLQPECGNYLVVEHNGDVFSCDFYVEEKWRLGNVMTENLHEMLNSSLQDSFGKRKMEITGACQDCQWLSLCHGGCVKDRFAGTGANVFCTAYKKLFAHADAPMKELAEKLKDSFSYF